MGMQMSSANKNNLDVPFGPLNGEYGTGKRF